MGALPKRRHSTSRKGKRITSQGRALKPVTTCKHCGSLKPSHRLCPNCKKK